MVRTFLWNAFRKSGFVQFLKSQPRSRLLNGEPFNQKFRKIRKFWEEISENFGTPRHLARWSSFPEIPEIQSRFVQFLKSEPLTENSENFGNSGRKFLGKIFPKSRHTWHLARRSSFPEIPENYDSLVSGNFQKFQPDFSSSRETRSKSVESNTV